MRRKKKLIAERRRKGETNTARKKPYDEETGRFKPRDVIKSDEEMDEQNLAVVESSALYSRDVDAGTKVSMIVSSIAEQISYVGEPIEFNDTEKVRDTVIRYLESCDRIHALPSKIGLARACGCDRSAFDKFVRRNPNHKTAIFLQIVTDAFSEALTQASLNGSVQPIVAIFLQKALYGMRENEQIATPVESPLGEITDTETLMKKYEELTVD